MNMNYQISIYFFNNKINNQLVEEPTFPYLPGVSVILILKSLKNSVAKSRFFAGNIWPQDPRSQEV